MNRVSEMIVTRPFPTHIRTDVDHIAGTMDSLWFEVTT